jgi:hypothetical protein
MILYEYCALYIRIHQTEKSAQSPFNRAPRQLEQLQGIGGSSPPAPSLYASIYLYNVAYRKYKRYCATVPAGVHLPEQRCKMAISVSISVPPGQPRAAIIQCRATGSWQRWCRKWSRSSESCLPPGNQCSAVRCHPKPPRILLSHSVAELCYPTQERRSCFSSALLDNG